MPAYAHRHSCTMWYYDAREKAEAIAAAKVAQGPAGPGTTTDDRLAAKDLIRDILAVGLGLRVQGLGYGVEGWQPRT